MLFAFLFLNELIIDSFLLLNPTPLPFQDRNTKHTNAILSTALLFLFYRTLEKGLIV